jgi:branched-chain amino acid transport system substrate-binding protein
MGMTACARATRNLGSELRIRGVCYVRQTARRGGCDGETGGALVTARRRAFVAALSIALLAAACGDDGGSNASTTTNGGAATTAGGGSATSAAPACKLDRPLKIVGLAEKPPEGTQAIADFANGWDLAIADLNAKGGVCGQQVSFERVATSPTDAAAAKSSYLTALDKKADITVGINSAGVGTALAPEIAKAATPHLYQTSPPAAFLGAKDSVGSPWGFILRPRTVGGAEAQAEYLVKDLGKKNIGLLCVNVAFGITSCDAATGKIEALGGKVVDRETNEPSDTNLTSKVLALKNSGADALLIFTFPNNQVTFYNQMLDNGYNVPNMGGASAALAIATKNVKPESLPNMLGFEDCVPSVDPNGKAFADAYKAKYNAVGGYNAAESYDSIFVAAAAVTKAGSLDKKAIADALRTIEYKGVCTTYKADAGQGMNRSSSVVSFDSTGNWVLIKNVAVLPPAAGG